MSWLKKLTKKPRKPSEQPMSLGIPSPISSVPPATGPELNTDVGPKGENNLEDSRIETSGRVHQRFHGSSTSASGLTHGHTVETTAILEQELPQNTQNEQFSRGTALALSTKMESEDSSRQERTDQETVAGRRTEILHVEQNLEVEASEVIPDSEAEETGFGSLKTALSAVHADYKEFVAIRNKTEDLISQVDALEQHFDSLPGGREEMNRRNDVISKLEEIEVRLRFGHQRLGSQQLATPAQDPGNVSGPLEDLREIIFDYQMIQQIAAYERGCNLINPAEATVLNSFRSAHGAEYRHGDRKGCLKGTRGSVLEAIEQWTRDIYGSPIYWLNGLAGTGKSTIAQTIAERTFADGRLGASFFCSRDFEDRSDLRLIFPTLAVQLSRKYTEFRSVFVPLVQSDPEIAHESLHNQMDKLIVRPLAESTISTVIVIDALDECKDEETTSAILSVLGRLVSKVPKAKFFLTGRPEPRIQTGFRLPLLRKITDVFILHHVEQKLITNDVRLFFKHSFTEIADCRGGLDGWPTDEEIELLCERAAGLFVYAVATVKFIDKRGTSPRKQLALLLQSPESSVREAKMKFKTNTTLDSLYKSILQEAFGDEDDPDNDPKVHSVVGTVLLASNPLSPSTIATLLDLDIDDVFPLLSSIQSLLILQEDFNCPVRPFHKSFPDFLVDPDRCTNLRFHVSPPHHHSHLLISCLDLMARSLEKNLCKLPDGVANSDVNDLKERVERYINPALQYACRSWHTHLVGGYATLVDAPKITLALHQFLEKSFLFWLEVMSVMGVLRIAVDALQAVGDRLEASPTLDLANDCCHFVTQNFRIISTSSPHIYHSALVLAPQESIVKKLYKSYALPFVRVVCGIPVSWDPSSAAMEFNSHITLAIWSPCNRFIAISLWETRKVDIFDAVTLQRLQSFDFPWEVYAFSEAFAFSPDIHMLTSARNDGSDSIWYVATWDLQTGGVISVIWWRGPHDIKAVKPHIVYLENGRMVAVLSQYESSIIISIYDVFFGVHMYDVHHSMHTDQDLISGAPYIYKIWTHAESLQFSTPGQSRISIWEVGFTPGVTPTKVESVSLWDSNTCRLVYDLVEHGAEVLTEFHPALSRLAFIENGDTLLIWDAKTSKFLLRYIAPNFYHPHMTFSSDGHFFACTHVGSDVHLWKESSAGYAFLGNFTPSSRYSIPHFSPNGESIITFGNTTLQQWHTKGFTTTTPIISTKNLQHAHEDFILEFLLDRPLAVVAQIRDRVVTVFDPKSGIPESTIDIPIEVYGLRAVENTIVFIGKEKAIIWNLPEGNFHPNTRIDVEDNTQIIDFGNPDNYGMMAASISLDLKYIALARHDGRDEFLDVYCTSTGKTTHGGGGGAYALWFTPGEREIWCASMEGADVFTITQDTLEHTRTVADVEEGPGECPWTSLHGYKVTYDGWIVGVGGKRLLMLPPLWHSKLKGTRVWNKKFLGLVHGGLPELVILELEP